MIEWVVARWCLLSCFEFVVALFPVLFWSFALVCHCVALCVCVFRDVFGSSPCVVPLSVFLCLPVFFYFLALCLYGFMSIFCLAHIITGFYFAIVHTLFSCGVCALHFVTCCFLDYIIFGFRLFINACFLVLNPACLLRVWQLGSHLFATSDRMSLKRVAPVVHFFYVVFTLNNYVCYM